MYLARAVKIIILPKYELSKDFLTFQISTGVAVFGILVHLLLADYTFGVSIRSPPKISNN
jgi:hypothetical protein